MNDLEFERPPNKERDAQKQRLQEREQKQKRLEELARKRLQKQAQERLVNPLESQEQATLFEWARLMENRYPELRLMYHIPNGGLRNKPVAVTLTAQGVRRGVPDICLPVARHEFHGLYIELKRLKGGKVSQEQADWILLLKEQGYKAEVCYGFADAKNVLEEYLK
jgi:hypothetical protein